MDELNPSAATQQTNPLVAEAPAPVAPAPMPEPAPAPVAPAPMPEPAPAPVAPAAKDLYAALACFPLLFLVSLWKAGQNERVKHASQYGMLFLLIQVVLYFVTRLMMWVAPLSLLVAFALLQQLLAWVLFGLSLYSAWKAWNGSVWEIPHLSSLAAKLPVSTWFEKVRSHFSKNTPPAQNF